MCALAGAAAALAWPDVQTWLARVLIGWNVLAWLYLGWVAIILSRADSGHIKRVALAQADSATNVLVVVVLAAMTSLVAVVFELMAAKAAGPHHVAEHLLLAFVTVLGSWLLLPTLFALTYAATYYAAEPDEGLEFPGATAKFEPDHSDFLYFSCTIAVTAQTSDVARDDARDAPARAVPVGPVVRVQHDSPGVRDQRRCQLLLGPEQELRLAARMEDAAVAALQHALRRSSAPPGDRAGAPAASTRADSIASSSPASTGTTAWATMGPWSRSAVTKCTLAPATLQPASIARAMRVQARERRQQRRVDVDDAALEALHEAGGQDAHEAGQHDHVGTETLDRIRQRGIEGVARRERLVVDDRGGDAVRSREAAGPGRRRGC